MITQRAGMRVAVALFAGVVLAPAAGAHDGVNEAVRLVENLRSDEAIKDDQASVELTEKLQKAGELADTGDATAARERVAVLVQEVKRLGFRITEDGARQLIERLERLKSELGGS